jgi:hypothetical protein
LRSTKAEKEKKQKNVRLEHGEHVKKMEYKRKLRKKGKRTNPVLA